MDPVTIAIISFILTFLAAKKGGLSTTGALLAATGVAGGSYYLANKYQSGNASGPLKVDEMSQVQQQETESAVSGWFGSVGDWIASNPGLAIGGVGAGLGLANSKTRPWLIMGAVALGAIVILK